MPLPEWLNTLRNRFFKKGIVFDEDALLALRQRHNTRCIAFKLFIAANNKVLETMADMEEALQGQRIFGMHYVRSKCINVISGVYQMIEYFEVLSEAPCTELRQRLSHLRESINALLESQTLPKSSKMVLRLDSLAADYICDVGPKAQRLAEAAAALDLDIPQGFVLTAGACRYFMTHNDLQSLVDTTLQQVDSTRNDALFTASSTIQQAILKAPMPKDLRKELADAMEALEQESPEQVRLAVRSCALGEDSLETSFAGQYHTELNVEPCDLEEACKKVMASKYSVTAMTYRLSKGLREQDADMSVACMRMVRAEAGGVVYTRNPLGADKDCLLVNMVLGLPCAVVNGHGQSDAVLINRRNQVIEKLIIFPKNSKFLCSDIRGLEQIDTTDDECCKPAMSDAELLELAGVCMRLEKYFRHPQDVEFALDADRKLYILQCRPLMVQKALPKTEALQGAPLILEGGSSASLGVAHGEIFVLRKDMDILRCPDNAVVVTERAEPRWAPLLHRISAFIAEQGSVAGHLGNVAREFGVPAIFGMAGCMDAFAPGVRITVDADNCRVYTGNLLAEFGNRQEKPSPMLGSPVHTTLQAVMEHIAPLHLLQPDGPDFTPQNCTTLHDITRYCHELSVRLMFSAENDQDVLKQMSMQLFHKVPMQYWVIDLGDGVAKGERERFVLLDDIRSAPMLALWKGMTAVPVEAPQVNFKGFLSVLAESSANPHLESGAASNFSMRNYFLISKDFCNLQSRFGYHFCTVEALMGDKASENYLAFQFKGGAADQKRRNMRAEFVRNLLEERGFRCEVKQDALFARLEGLERRLMRRELTVVGYLIMHTRQLDMVMNDLQTVSTKKNTMLTHIQSITAPDATKAHSAGDKA